MATIVYISYIDISDIGAGGHHRAYQMAHDLETVGMAQVQTITLSQWGKTRSFVDRALNWGIRKCRLNKLKIRLSFDNPYNLIAFTSYTTKHFVPATFFRYYEKKLKTFQKPVVCVLADTRFGKVVEINKRHRIPTVLCIQNLESFDNREVDLQRKSTVKAAAVDFANEFWLLSQADARLFISQVETGIVGGLGLSVTFYPYLPVGKIRQRLEDVRQRRSATSPQEGLFLMLGSADHDTTRDAMRWFVEQAQRGGIPKGYQIIVGGQKTDQLLPPDQTIPGLELRGWLSQPELDRLLSQIKGVLIPQQSGFGALTRLPELACAGIPVIVSEHPTYAIDNTPGLYIAEDNWSNWCEKMEQLNEENIHVSKAEYEAWESSQPQPLAAVVKQLFCKKYNEFS